MAELKVGCFSIDATPPPGHPCCGGWIAPVSGVDDPQLCRGVVLLGLDAPIVLATVDWTGVLNRSHRIWAETLAGAVGTTPERVMIHSLHQHNAPFVDDVANAICVAGKSPSLVHDEAFVADVRARSAAAVAEAARTARPAASISVGAAKVDRVASNRRVLGPDGRVRLVRTSASRDPAAAEAPEGLIDPELRSIVLRDDRERPIARLYFYATHPMSYYGDGRASADFVGLARLRRDYEEPGTLHLYFTGASGNVTAGKYNDGRKVNRAVLTDRVHAAMRAADAEADRDPRPIELAAFASAPLILPPRADFDADRLRAVVADESETLANRNRAAMAASWMLRVADKRPITLGALRLNHAATLHLPAESFVEYQLLAKELAKPLALGVAAYGDGGPWYIPLEKSFAEGGYEPSVAFVAPEAEAVYNAAIRELVARAL